MSRTHFDTLVLGAGSAGCIVAARLSEDPAHNVGLIEAGDIARDPDIAVPQVWPALEGRPIDWAYATTPQPGTAGRTHAWARGKVVGGSSAINALAHVRGHAHDFARWAEATGSQLWSYEGLLPAFIRSETFSRGASAMHGDNGPLPLLLPDGELSPVVRAYIEAGVSLGVPRLAEHNAGPLKGVAPNTLTLRDGRRVTVADAYLTPALARPNLTLLTRTDVHRLTFERDRVTGIEAAQHGARTHLAADRVVLALGSIATPLLLMRSGIGPADVLASARIPCRLDRRDVGRNLQDHLFSGFTLYAARQPVPPSRLQHSESLMYLDAADITQRHGAPDVMLTCVVAPTVTDGFAAPPYGEAYTILSGVTHPTSRGTLAVTGPDLTDPPRIDPAYLSTDHDRRLARRALEIARAVGAAAPLDGWRSAELLPGPLRTDAEADAFVARAARTHHHPVGTCRMGKDDEAIVDADLSLRGVMNCAVVDGSVIPTLPSGPVHAAIIAIAETWSSIHCRHART